MVVLSDVCKELGIDPGTHTPGCKVVRDLGTALVTAMETALGQGSPAAARIVACECVMLAETKDHADWELIGEAAKGLDGKAGESYQGVVPGIVARIVGP